MKKVCTVCGIEHNLDNFRTTKRNISNIRNECRDCEKEYARLLAAEKRKWVQDYKLACGCKVCGYNKNPYALQLNHVDPSSKDESLKKERKAYKANWSLDKIKLEIAKCEVLCANCHAELTHEDGAYFKQQQQQK